VNAVSYAFSIVASLAALGVVVERLRRRRLRERHAVWWLAAGFAALVLSVFPGLLEGLADLVGIQEPSNLAFFASLLVVFVVCVQYSAELTDLEDKVRRLAEESAIATLRLRELERRVTGHQGADDAAVRRPARGVAAGPGGPTGPSDD